MIIISRTATIVQNKGLLAFNTISHSCSAFKLILKLNYIITLIQLLQYTLQFPGIQNSNYMEKLF